MALYAKDFSAKVRFLLLILVVSQIFRTVQLRKNALITVLGEGDGAISSDIRQDVAGVKNVST